MSYAHNKRNKRKARERQGYVLNYDLMRDIYSVDGVTEFTAEAAYRSQRDPYLFGYAQFRYRRGLDRAA